MRTLLSVLYATWFFSGLIPPILTRGFAGTYGTLAALPLCYGLVVGTAGFSGGTRMLLLVGASILVLGLSLITIPRATSALSPWIRRNRRNRPARKISHDPYEIVIDEVFGMLISCLPLVVFEYDSLGAPLAIAFVFFRIFDGVKPYPARYCERACSVWSILFDDLVAGLYTAIILAVLSSWL